ncbi:MAG: TetR/AcrR family transcriptional regulator [Anaerolineae bacterium]|nr:TetR/AcrR family transcriptional regulator [Anaerolineae bacterium]
MPGSKILTAADRRHQNHAQMREDILAIAREMMQSDGVAALSFNAIARRLGIKPPSLYTYFESKHAIYDELFRRGYESFGQRMAGSIDPALGLAANLERTIETYMTFALENPDLFQLMFQRPVPGFVPSERSMAASLGALHQGRANLQRVIEAGGQEIDLPLDRAGDLLIALMHGLTELQLANNPEQPAGEGRYGRLVQDAVQLFVRP